MISLDVNGMKREDVLGEVFGRFGERAVVVDLNISFHDEMVEPMKPLPAHGDFTPSIPVNPRLTFTQHNAVIPLYKVSRRSIQPWNPVPP